MTWKEPLLAVLLLVPRPAAAQSGFCDPSFVAVPACAADGWGPPLACSNSPAGTPVACVDDGVCCGGCLPSNHCPGPRRPRCVEWPFIDVDSDGCYDPTAGDTPLPWPDIDATCVRTQTSGAPGCVALPDGGTTCHHDTLPVACTFHPGSVEQRWVIAVDTTAIGPLAGLTTPAGMRCLDGTAMLHSLGTADRATFVVTLNGDFRNYAWGAWKNHLTHTRFLLQARNVVLGGYETADPRNPKQGTQFNWDKDTQIDARGCILLGAFEPRANTVRMNGGRPGDMLLLRARGGLFIDRSWLISAHRGLVRAEGCPLSVTGIFKGNPKQQLPCPRCVADAVCGDACDVAPDPLATVPEDVARGCPEGAVCAQTGIPPAPCP